MKTDRILKLVFTILIILIGQAVSGTNLAAEEAGKNKQSEKGTSFLKTVTLPAVPDKHAAGLEEKVENKIRLYKSAMDASQYRKAFKETGMDKAVLSKSSKLAATVTGAAATASPTAVWVQAGPVGDFSSRNGRVAGIQIISTGLNTYRVYAGASSGGLWRSDSQNLGSWTSIGDLIPHPSVRAFAVDPNNSSRIFVGTGDPGRWPGGGMYMTTNEGASWSAVTLPVDPEVFYRLYFVPGLSGRLIAASDQGILLSINDGATWTLEQGGDITDLVIDPSDSQYMYAVRTYTGVYRSTDAGNTWTQLTDPDLPTGIDWDRATLAVSPSNPAVVAIVVEKNYAINGVYRTTDAKGSSPDWTDISGTLTPFGNMGFHALSIAIRPDDENQIFVANSDIARTDDGGQSWKKGDSQTGINKGHADITNLYFSDVTGNDVLWITNDGGIYKHIIGGATTSVNGSTNGLAISQINYMDADRNMRVAGLQDNGIIRTIDSGQTWEFIGGGDGYNVEITDPEANNFWFTEGNHSAPYTSYVWRLIYGSSPVKVSDLASSIPLFYDRYDDAIFSSDSFGIVSRPESGNVNDPWQLEVDNFQTDAYNIRGIKGSPVDGKTIIVAYNDPNRRDVTIARKSGSAWNVIHRENIAPSSSGIVSVPCCGIFPSPQWTNELWITLEGLPGTSKILHSSDDGQTWDDITGNLDQVKQVNSFAATPFNPLILYAGTDFGVFRSINGGTTWEPFMDGLPIVPVHRLYFVVDDQHTGNHKLVAGTFGRGIWECTIQSPSILYVDKDYSGTQDGTFEHPYTTVAAAVDAAPAGSVIAIRSNVYTEPQTVSKNVTLVTYGGTSLIR